ncbi:cytochrome c [bacterium]|nr:cytochrome c [bacterium]
MAFCLVAPGMVMAKDGNARKGKYLYRKYCRECHKEGATGDRVGKPLSPVSKTQAQWEEVFKNAKSLACADQWSQRKEADIDDIYAHLWGHAYDSPSPAKCE